MWMKHAEHGGVADLPDMPYWRSNGWEPTDERPTEPDLLHDPEPEDTEDTEDPEEPSGSFAVQPTEVQDVEGDVTHA
jgi:hypothetical protein